MTNGILLLCGVLLGSLLHMECTPWWNLIAAFYMNSDIGTAHHLSISDAEGNSVVVEYIAGNMQVTDTPVITNHYLTVGEHFGIGSEQSHTRYNTLISNLENC